MLTCYPQPGKQRSRLVLEAFAAGCGGKVGQTGALLVEGAAAFYGVVGIEYLYRLAVAEGRDWYYGDNSFFDRTRGKFFRFAKNQPQVCRPDSYDFAKAKDLGLNPRPWRQGGKHIVVVEQSEHFLDLMGEKNWLRKVLDLLKGLTDRPLLVRRWRRDKDKAAETLHADLHGAWALVTHMSAAANEALLAGVPVFTSGNCSASCLASGPLSNVEKPRRPDGREEWAAWLAGMQWTLEELREGAAWKALNDD